MKYLVLFWILIINLQASNANKDINNVIQEREQAKRYEVINEKLDGKDIKYYKLEPIKLEVEPLDEECLEIERINFIGSTIIPQNTLKKLSFSYLNDCNGIKKLNNLAKKVTNMYIKKGYITSRAYIKIQDLSDGEIDINIIEGKINEVKSNNIYIGNTYRALEGKILNIRDLEVGIQEHERLKSNKVVLKLFPANKIGYTNILIINKKVSSAINGKILISQYKSKYYGDYQIATYLNYDNPFNINDIITLNFNTTEQLFDKENNLKGSSISYGLPYMRNYFKFAYSDFKYNQKVLNTQNNYVDLSGTVNEYKFSYNYKIFHSLQHKVSFNTGVKLKNSVFYQNNTLLKLESVNTNTINLSLMHNYKSKDTTYYMNFTVNKFTNNLVKENSQINYGLDIALISKPFKNYRLITSNLFHILYAKKQRLGVGQINIGGNYSVRGFGSNGLSGYIGGFLRNDFTYATKIKSFLIIPFVAIDFGYIQDDIDVNPGTIIGSSLGLAISYKKHSLKTYYNKPIKHTKETELYENTYSGITYEYKF